MRAIDKVMKRYLSDNERFADIFNAYLGEQILSSSHLEEMDSRTITNIKNGSDSELVEKFRDIIYKAGIDMDFVIMGIENQAAVDYAMPIRVMVYDAIVYNEQLNEIAKDNKSNKKCQSGAEFISKFRKKDKVKGVLTLIVYYGQKPWDGSLDLHGIVDLEGVPASLRDRINNYPINILEVNKFKDIDRFKTDLGAVFQFVQHSKDKKKLRKFVHEHRDEFKGMDDDTYDVIAQLTGQKYPIEHKEEYKESEGYNMCKAIDDMIEDGKREGKIEGENYTLSRISNLIGIMTADECGKEVVRLADQNFLQKMLQKYGL